MALGLTAWGAIVAFIIAAAALVALLLRLSRVAPLPMRDEPAAADAAAAAAPARDAPPHDVPPPPPPARAEE